MAALRFYLFWLLAMRPIPLMMAQCAWVCVVMAVVTTPAVAQSTSAQASVVAPTAGQALPLTASLEYAKQPTDQRWQLEDVLTLEPSHWQVPEDTQTRDVNFGFTNHAYWFRFEIENPSSDARDLIVHLDYALIDYLEFYALKSVAGADTRELAERYTAGDAFPFHARPIAYPTFAFPVSLAAGERKSIYLRAETTGTMQVPLALWEERAFLVNKQTYVFFYGAFLSALLMMAAYNLCLFFIVKARSYLIYSLFIVCMVGVHASLDGFSYQWFWPSVPEWHQISSLFFILTGLWVTVLFTRSVLPVPPTSKLNGIIKFLAIYAPAAALLAPFLSYRYAAMLSGVTTIIVMSGVSFVCLAMLRHSPRIARFYCAAWGIYFFGIVLKSLSKLGYIPYTMLSENAGNIGGVVGVVMISLALADRINNERRAKEAAQSQSIGHLKRFENLYQNALEGIFSFSLQGKLVSANPSFLAILGIDGVAAFNNSPLRSSTFHLTPNTFSKLLARVQKEGELVNEELRVVAMNGDTRWVNVSARLAQNEENGEALVEGTVIDITDRKSFEEKLVHLASHDPLTGFLNRRAFEELAREKLASVRQYREVCCILYLDLDQFKIVNDLCGHTAGDALLKNLSQRLRDHLQEIDEQHTIARLGGDEFGIILASTGLEQAQDIAEKLRDSVESFLFVWDGNRFTLGVSVGLVEVCPYHDSVEQLLVMADTACYKAKDLGRNRVYTFIETDKELQFRQLEMQWVATIKEAIKDDDFFLVFQHIASNREQLNGPYHYEILLRLMSSGGNLCAPNQFLPAAERYNLMPNIDRWVVSHYFTWLREHPEHHANLGCASINLSTQSIGDDTFLEFLVAAFTEFAIEPTKICFEITESVAISNLDNTHSFIKRLKKLGCRFALDDFGTGFSSYAYLKELDIDYLKIDGVFIRNLGADAVNIAMVKSISDVAKAMGIETVAEFVESEACRQQLIDIGINYSQGYHIHKPVNLESGAFNVASNDYQI